jgi:cyanophycin synthetase
VGVPVPDGSSVSSADEAWTVAQEIGLPVVVKPEDGNQGKGVSPNLRSEADIRAAYDIAKRAGRGNGVLVEQFIEGDDYRLLVVGGKMIAAARRDPAMVVGDGRRTIRELVEHLNQDPRRRDGHSTILTRIRLDEAAELVVQQQGMTFDSVPRLGTKVLLRQNSNLSTGGTAVDVTDVVHPKNARIAELAAQILRLDVAGIDILCRDIRRPMREQQGAIVEVNAAPGLRMHVHPSEGTGRDVGRAVIDMLYPDGATARIPIIAVTGTNGKTTVTRLIAHIYETAHKIVGMTSTNGVWIDGERIITGDCSGPKSALAVLLHPNVEVAVLETARGGILREGLAFDTCTVGVVMNVTSDHLGLKGINTIEELAKVKQVVVENVARDGAAVLNAEDPLVAQMAAATDGRVIYFSTDPNNPVLRAHLNAGEQGVFVRDNTIVIATGRNEMALTSLDQVAFTYGGRIGFQVQNALASVAACWGAGVNPAMIARGLTTFRTDGDTVPGRFNISNRNGVEVIVDYGHNPAAMAAMGSALTNFDTRRTIVLLGLPGDRRDGDLIETVDTILPHADEFVFYDLPDRRGRGVLEVPRLLATRLPEHVPYSFSTSQADGVRHCWSKVRPGDRLLLIVDVVDEALGQVEAFGPSSVVDVDCVSPITAEAAML